MRALKEKYQMLLDETDVSYVRNIHNNIAWDERLIAILGARGVGKTTMVLQHIKLYEDPKTSLFVYADDIWFSSHSIIELAEDFYKDGGKALFIDEIHKYNNWSQEIKNIYDSFPRLRVCYTGSSILDLQKGAYDLSRRLLEYKMHGLSFREYISIKHNISIPIHTLDKLLANEIDFPYDRLQPLPAFKDYLMNGYYPYFNNAGYYLRLDKTINAILENDIPKFAELSISMTDKLKTLLFIIAQSVPFKPNYSKIARDLNTHRNAIADLMIWLDKANLINILRDETKGISLLGKVEKIYLNNPNLAYLLSDKQPDIGNIRETIFLTWMNTLYPVTSSKEADFKIRNYTFEIGGKDKKHKQIKNIENAFLVKDNIEYGYKNEIPLWAFGLLY
ncbi:MAG: AAA family ATPase [Bacteroidales bacterium]|nr:AAA family ATPase [Bacteroidales bacterium]